MMENNVIILIVAVGLVILLRLRNAKVYQRHEEAQKVMIDRQAESLVALKEISATLKEISQKLDNK